MIRYKMLKKCSKIPSLPNNILMRWAVYLVDLSLPSPICLADKAGTLEPERSRHQTNHRHSSYSADKSETRP